MNNTYGSIYFSIFMINVENLIFLLLKINNSNFIYIIDFISIVLFFVIGWFLNKMYYKYTFDKTVDRIQKKYNQQHVIHQLREELEERNYNEDMNKSLETIGISYYTY